MGIFDSAFACSEKTFDNLSRGQSIGPKYVSRLASNSKLEKYGPGFGRAAALLLSGEAEIYRDDQHNLMVTYVSSSKSAQRVTLTSQSGPLGRIWGRGSLDSGSGAPLLAMAEALALGLWPETRRALRELAQESGYLVGLDQLKSFTSNDHHVGLVHAVCNATYHEIMQAENNGEIKFSTVNVGNGLHPVDHGHIRGALGISSKQLDRSTQPLTRLRRLMNRGGAALLIGPPGTFKTETIKRLALDSGASVVKMRGAPGIEDRDFIGCVMPTDSGPAWVDGPLPSAFTLARSGKTILHIDEILRYHYIHLNVLVGAMDELTAQEIRAVLVPPLHAALKNQGLSEADIQRQIDERLNGETPDPAARYYMLTLPGGDVLVCPKTNLLFAMTTNMGEDNLQTSQEIDAALLSRIHLVIDYARPDMDVVMPIYEQVAGGNQDLAQFAYEIENLTHELMHNQDSALARSLDPRKTIAMIEEARAAMDEGMALKDALLDAALVTALPHCISRDSHGNLEQHAYDLLNAKIKSCLKQPTGLSSF